jgi:outer membrane protein OmpA-like peptidoglycan-associated protein
MGAMNKPLDAVVRISNSRTVCKGLVMVFGSALFLSACSDVPDAVNPAAWYRAATSSDDASKPAASDSNDLQAGRNTPAPGADGKTPNLSRVDEQMANRKNATAGLGADTAGRKYADSVQRQSDAPQNSLYAEDKAPAAPKIEAQQAAPTPQPAKPVMTTQAPAQPTAAPAAVEASAAPVKAGPDPSYGVDPGMRDRLAKQLAEIQARAADQGSLLLSDLTASGQGQQTIIISSGGIESSSAQSTSNIAGFQRLNVMPEGQVENAGALPLPSASTRVATILFNNGSAGLDENDRRILADVAKLQRQNNGVVRVIGHASQRTRNMDPVVHKQANFQVSVDRANQVATELKKMGISSDMILTAAVGDNHPLYLEVMPSGEAGNRRTEIYLSN